MQKEADLNSFKDGLDLGNNKGGRKSLMGNLDSDFDDVNGNGNEEISVLDSNIFFPLKNEALNQSKNGI